MPVLLKFSCQGGGGAGVQLDSSCFFASSTRTRCIYAMTELPVHFLKRRSKLRRPNGETTISLAKFQGIILETNDIAGETERLAGGGVEVGKIDDTPWGKFMWLKDEDGNGLCLHQK